MENFKDYMFAGKAIFTVESTKIDKRYTYKVKKSTDNLYRVSFMYDTDKYRFMCVIGKDSMCTFNIKCGEEDPRYKMFRRFCDFVSTNTYPDTCKIYKSKYCARCGRLLTTPESIETGLGPNCRKYLYKEV